MLPRLASLISVILATLALAGCAADSLSNADTNQGFNQLVKPYDKTLTKSEQKATIADLQNAQVKHDDESATQDGTPAATPTGTN